MGPDVKIWLSLGSPESFFQGILEDGVQVRWGRRILVLKGIGSLRETGGSHVSCDSTNPWAQVGGGGEGSCVREIGRQPTFRHRRWEEMGSFVI